MQIFPIFILLLLILFITILLIFGVFQKKSKIAARLSGSFLVAGPLFIIWVILAIGALFSPPIFGISLIWYASAGCAAVYVICLIFIWKPFTAKRRRIAAIVIAAPFVAVIVTVFTIDAYQNSIAEMSDVESPQSGLPGSENNDEMNLYNYQPFVANTLVKSLDEPSNLRLLSDLPRLDGATALFPLYSAFVRATYPEDGKYIYTGYFDEEQTLYGPYPPTVFCSRTSGAFYNLLAGTADVVFLMGISDEQQARADELGLTLQMTPIGSEAFVFLVNKNNAVSNLTVQNIKDIYSGQVTNWKDAGGKNDEIRAYQRPQNSGSQTQLEKIMGDTPIAQAPEKDVFNAMMGMYKAIANYKNYKNALGYSFRFYINDMISEDFVKLLPIDGIEPSVENIANGSYPFADNFYAITVTGRENQTEEDKRRADNAKRLIEWILSPQGQSLVEKTGYVPLLAE